ncbi:hypothetical protein BSQ98_00245, partial [Serratia liquefaciens]
AAHLSDIRITTPLYDGFRRGELVVEAHVNRPTQHRVQLQLWRDGQLIGEKIQALGSEIIDERGAYDDRTTLRLPVEQPALWSAETPTLYRATLALLAPDGEIIEVEAYDVGFRQIDISNGLL